MNREKEIGSTTKILMIEESVMFVLMVEIVFEI